jgi:hypothetical protein
MNQDFTRRVFRVFYPAAKTYINFSDDFDEGGFEWNGTREDLVAYLEENYTDKSVSKELVDHCQKAYGEGFKMPLIEEFQIEEWEISHKRIV